MDAAEPKYLPVVRPAPRFLSPTPFSLPIRSQRAPARAALTPRVRCRCCRRCSSNSAFRPELQRCTLPMLMFVPCGADAATGVQMRVWKVLPCKFCREHVCARSPLCVLRCSWRPGRAVWRAVSQVVRWRLECAAWAVRRGRCRVDMSMSMSMSMSTFMSM